MSDLIEVKLSKLWVQKNSTGEYLENPNFSIEVSNNTLSDWDGVLIDYWADSKVKCNAALVNG